jgi:O-antigen ligase
LLSPIIAFGIAQASGAKMKLSKALFYSGIAVIAIIPVLVYLGIDFDVIFADFLTGFDGSASDSSAIRVQQFWLLINEWSDSPIFGHGLGAAAFSITRSDEQTWAYELSYVALLFQTGLFGFLIYFSAVCWIYYRGIILMRKIPHTVGYFLPVLTGMTSFLLANATNPYLAKFDFLWVIFLPVGMINAFLLTYQPNSNRGDSLDRVGQPFIARL